MKYDYLFQQPGPPLLLTALKYWGITEKPGKASNPIILGWAMDLGVQNIYKDDDTPWCGLAQCAIVKEAGLPMPFTGYEVVRAKSWVNYGVEVDTPVLGDILVFGREGGHHVGMYVAHSPTTYHVLGGNQSNKFGVSEIAKVRCIAKRRPEYLETPENLISIFISSTGKISTNEA